MTGLDYVDTYNNPNPHDEQVVSTMLDIPYLRMVRNVLSYGHHEENRTSVKSISIFGLSARYDLRDRFPLFTCKRSLWKHMIIELFWMLRGHQSISALQKAGVSFWDEWADWNMPTVSDDPYADQPAPLIYGAAMRHYPSANRGDDVDQLAELVKGLEKDPQSRRHIISLWHPDSPEYSPLPPCHGNHIQFKRQTDSRGVERLHCAMVQRSCDLFLGCPVNVAAYALFTCMLARHLGIQPGFLTHHVNDAHIYVNHVEQVREMLDRPLRESPRLVIEPSFNFSDQTCLTGYMSPDTVSLEKTPDFFNLVGYNPHPVIKGDVAV